MSLFKHCNSFSFLKSWSSLIYMYDCTWSDICLPLCFPSHSTFLAHSTPSTLVSLIFLEYSRHRAFLLLFLCLEPSSIRYPYSTFLNLLKSLFSEIYPTMTLHCKYPVSHFWSFSPNSISFHSTHRFWNCCLLTQHLLIICCVPGTVLVARDISMNKINKNICLHGAYIPERGDW